MRPLFPARAMFALPPLPPSHGPLTEAGRRVDAGQDRPCVGRWDAYAFGCSPAATSSDVPAQGNARGRDGGARWFPLWARCHSEEDSEEEEKDTKHEEDEEEVDRSPSSNLDEPSRAAGESTSTWIPSSRYPRTIRRTW